MAGTKISALTAAAALGGTEEIPGVQSAANVKITATQIKTFTSASPTLVTPVLGVATGTSLALQGAGGTSLALGGTANGIISFTRSSNGMSYQFVGDNSGSGGPAEFRLGSTANLMWNSGTGVGVGTLDTNLSRISAGVIGVGTGAQGSVAGELRATNIELTTGGYYSFGSRGGFQASADGAFVFRNAANSMNFTITAGASNLATFNGPVTVQELYHSGVAAVRGSAQGTGLAIGPAWTGLTVGQQGGLRVNGGATGIWIQGPLGWVSGATHDATSADLMLTRSAAATLQHGAADAASPVAQTIKFQDVVAGTTNTAGVNATIQAPAGTGTGAGGSLIFQVAPAGSSGSAKNAWSTALTITPIGVAAFVGQVSSVGLNAGTGNIVNSAGYIGELGYWFFKGNSDGVVELVGAGLTGSGFGRLQLGGNTSSFPALKRSTTSLQARLADDSAFTNIQGKLTTDTAYTAGDPTTTGYLLVYDSTGTAYRVPALLN